MNIDLPARVPWWVLLASRGALPLTGKGMFIFCVLFTLDLFNPNQFVASAPLLLSACRELVELSKTIHRNNHLVVAKQDMNVLRRTSRTT